MAMVRGFVGGGLAALILIAAVAARAQEPEPVGRVARQTGAVTVLRDDGPSLLLLGAPVFASDRIVTTPDARIMIAFGDGSSVVIGADSDIRVDEYATDGNGGRLSAVLSLLAGIVRAAVQPAEPGGFAVRTETAVASARSTEWTIEFDADNTAVFVIDGRVAVAGADPARAVVLEPGFGTDVAAGAPPTEPKRWGAERVERTLARVRLP